MSDANLIRQMQKQLAEAEVERLRLVEQLEAAALGRHTALCEDATTARADQATAILFEREACAQLAEAAYEWEDATDLAAQIRARGDE